MVSIAATVLKILHAKTNLTAVTPKQVRLEVEAALGLERNALKPKRDEINAAIAAFVATTEDKASAAAAAAPPAAAVAAAAAQTGSKRKRVDAAPAEFFACHVKDELRAQLLLMCGVDPKKPFVDVTSEPARAARAAKLRENALKLERVAGLTEDANENAMLLLQSNLKLLESGVLVQQDTMDAKAKGAAASLRAAFRRAAASFTAQARSCAARSQRGFAALNYAGATAAHARASATIATLAARRVALSAQTEQTRDGAAFAADCADFFAAHECCAQCAAECAVNGDDGSAAAFANELRAVNEKAFTFARDYDTAAICTIRRLSGHDVIKAQQAKRSRTAAS
jgi:hypothetical protein